jgi:hypothetical protein
MTSAPKDRDPRVADTVGVGMLDDGNLAIVPEEELAERVALRDAEEGDDDEDDGDLSDLDDIDDLP